MKTSIECWRWLLTAKPTYELRLIQEIMMAWEFTIEKKMGIFGENLNLVSPLEANTDLKLEPLNDDNCPLLREIRAHNVWLEFISNLIESSKYCHEEKMEMLLIILHNSLSICVGESMGMNRVRHSSAVGARFKLLSCGLSMVQADSFPGNNLSKNILREKIYCNCLDYFCGPQYPPTQIDFELKDDIKVLLRFWELMHSEKKYLITKGDSASNLSKSLVTVSGIVNTAPNIMSTVNMNTNLNTTSNNLQQPSISSRAPSFLGPLNTMKSTKQRQQLNNDSFIKDCNKKRNLILHLLAIEIEFLSTW